MTDTDDDKTVKMIDEKDSLISDMPEPLLRLLMNSEKLLKNRADLGSLIGKNEVFEVTHGKDSGEDTSLDSIRTDLSRMFRAKGITKRSKHWIQWAMKMKVDGDDEDFPVLTIKFKYVPKLDIIVVEPKLSQAPNQQRLLSDMLLRAENILHFVRLEDYGNEAPNVIAQGQLLKARVFSFSELVLALGFPYRWAQDLCKIDYKDSSKEEQEQEGNKTILNIVKCISERFRRFLQTWKETRTFELRTMTQNKTYRFTPWTSVDVDLLERSFRLGQEIIPIELRRAKDRFLLARYDAKKFEVRVGVILHRDFPVKLPTFAIEVIDKRGSSETFVSHDYVKCLQMKLNADRLVNGVVIEPAHILQIIKLVFYVDELLQEKTFKQIAVLRTDSFWSVPRIPCLKIPKSNIENFNMKSNSPSKNVAVKSKPPFIKEEKGSNGVAETQSILETKKQSNVVVEKHFDRGAKKCSDVFSGKRPDVENKRADVVAEKDNKPDVKRRRISDSASPSSCKSMHKSVDNSSLETENAVLYAEDLNDVKSPQRPIEFSPRRTSSRLRKQESVTAECLKPDNVAEEASGISDENAQHATDKSKEVEMETSSRKRRASFMLRKSKTK